LCNYKGKKEKFYKTIVDIWYKKVSEIDQLTPKYICTKIEGSNKENVKIRNAAKHRIF